MRLNDALLETGCAISVDGQCTISVERISDDNYLLMTRRGVCILVCLFHTMKELETMHYLQDRIWQSARIAFEASL